MRSLLVLIGFASVVLGGVLVLVSWMTRRAKLEYEAAAMELKALAALSIGQAKRKAQELIGRGDMFKYVESTTAVTTLPDLLAPLIRGFLARYEVVETVTGPSTVIERSQVWSSPSRHGYLRIGTGMQGTDAEYELAVPHGREEIVELHRGEPPDAVFGTYPSIYHWVVAVAVEVEEGRRTGRE